MGFRTCVKIMLLNVLIIHSVYLVLWVLFHKPPNSGTLKIRLSRKNNNEQAMFDNLVRDRLYTSINMMYDTMPTMSMTTEITAKQKAMPHITLNPEVNTLLNVTFSRLKPPSLEGITFLLENKSICEVDNLTVVILIHSAPDHFEERKAIRQTWTNASGVSTEMEIRTIFIIGNLQDSELQALIEKEFLEYGDILQGNFEDGYKNLSLNSLYGYKWINENCANAKFVIKADDDIVVNMNKLFHAVNENLIFKKRTTEVACYRVRGSVHRDKESKFFVGEHVFMDTRFTVPFCEGKFVFMTMDLIPILLESASITPLFWIEDIYWYGLVMANIPDITYTNINWGDKIGENVNDAVDCLYNRRSCKFFITWAENSAEMIYIFYLMERNDKYVYTMKDFINATVYKEIRLIS